MSDDLEATIQDISKEALYDAVEEGTQGTTEWGYVNCVPQGELSPTRNWQALFRPCAADTTDLTPLGRFVSVHRGKSTGNVDFFCLSQDDVDRYGIAGQHLSRLIRQPKLIDGYGFRDEDWETLRDTGEELWLLDPDELPTVPESMDTFYNQATDTAGRNYLNRSPVSRRVRPDTWTTTDSDVHEITSGSMRSPDRYE